MEQARLRGSVRRRSGTGSAPDLTPRQRRASALRASSISASATAARQLVGGGSGAPTGLEAAKARSLGPERGRPSARELARGRRGASSASSGWGGATCWPRRAAPDGLHRLDALLLEDALHALDRVALPVEQRLQPHDERDVVGAVVAPSAAALQRLDLREAGLPETEHMVRQVEILRHLADRPEGVWALVDHILLRVRLSRPEAHSSSSLTSRPLMRAFMTLDGLNTITLRGSMGTSTPVFGFARRAGPSAAR